MSLLNCWYTVGPNGWDLVRQHFHVVGRLLPASGWGEYVVEIDGCELGLVELVGANAIATRPRVRHPG